MCFFARVLMGRVFGFFIFQFEAQAGFLPVLFQLILDLNIENEVRQAATIYAKNIIRSRWSLTKPDDSRGATIAESDKEILRANLFEAVVFTQPAPRC
jgi:hypothetical protein